MTLDIVANYFATKVTYRPAGARPFVAAPVPGDNPFWARPEALSVRNAAGEDTNLLEFLNDQPPSLYTLYSAAMIGREGLPELSTLRQREEATFYETWDWTDVVITAERRASDGRTVQDRAIAVLTGQDPDVLFFDDGKGELADLVVIQRARDRERGELVTVGLYHCKASSEVGPGARVADYYEVAGQAIKSARRLVFSDVREHLRQRADTGGVRGFLIGDIQTVDALLSGAIDRLYTYEIVVVQPGFSAQKLQANAEDLANLISITREMIDVEDFARYRLICSP